jgi:hypothetical protein
MGDAQKAGGRQGLYARSPEHLPGFCLVPEPHHAVLGKAGGLGLLTKAAKRGRFAYSQKFNPMPEVKTNCWFLPLFRAAAGLLV